MSLSDDKKLELFLKENRPLHPRHSEREADKIWARINVQDSSPTKWVEWFYGLTALVTVTFAFYFFSPSLETLSTSNNEEVAMVDESLDLGFLEYGELYEVSDLLAISK